MFERRVRRLGFRSGVGTGIVFAALIASVGYCLCPVASPDGKYMFFLSSPQSVSWVTTDFLTELKPAP